MQGNASTVKEVARVTGFIPQEQMQPVGFEDKSLCISMPKECSFQEKRVPLTPGSIRLLVNNGHRVIIEDEAGLDLGFTNIAYSDAGAQIVYSSEEIYDADIVLKVSPPTLDEVEMMKPFQVILSALQLSAHPENVLQAMMKKNVSAVAWEHIKDDSGIFPVVRAMGEIAGNSAILIASEYLSKAKNGIGILFGGISGVPPTNVVILGAGTVGEFATRAALGLGADVKILDNNISRLRRLQNDLGVRLFTSIIEPKVLEDILKDADVVVGALRSPYGRTPCVVTDEMVQNMKSGSVIVDVCIDQGGCFETSALTSHDHPVFLKHGVVHYGVPNIASRFPLTASQALSNIFAPIILQMGHHGGFENYLRIDKGFRNGVYVYQGTLTNKVLGRSFQLPSKDLDFILPPLY